MSLPNMTMCTLMVAGWSGLFFWGGGGLFGGVLLTWGTRTMERFAILHGLEGGCDVSHLNLKSKSFWALGQIATETTGADLQGLFGRRQFSSRCKFSYKRVSFPSQCTA